MSSRKLIILAGAVMMVLSVNGLAVAEQQDIEAEIKLVFAEPNRVVVHGVCQSRIDAQLSYKLIAKRSGHSGTSTSSQSGKFLPVVGESVKLGSIQFNLQPGDVFQFNLRIYRDGREEAVVEKEFSFL